MPLSIEAQSHLDFLNTFSPEVLILQCQQTRQKITQIPYIQDPQSGRITLDLPAVRKDDLPGVSLVTLTKNRRLIFHTALFCYMNFLYPRDRLEWIIVDDTDKPGESIVDLLPKGPDYNIRHVQLPRSMSISDKRNLGTSLSKYDLVMMMDDDDYYHPDSILAKVRAFAKYADKELVTSTVLAVYNVIKNQSEILQMKVPCSEASMMFRKSWWRKRPFQTHPLGEGFSLVFNAMDKIIDLPYMYNFISVTHYANITGSLRYYTPENANEIDFMKLIEQSAREFFIWLRYEIRKHLGVHADVITERTAERGKTKV